MRNRTVILADDGLATGATMMAAVRWARSEGAKRVIVAVPVGAPETVRGVQQAADRVFCLEVPEQLWSVGEWYLDFSQLSDQRVIALLAATPQEAASADVEVALGDVRVEATLVIPSGATGVVLFAHGSGSSRLSPRNREVAERLNEVGLGTMLLDLLTVEEARDRALVFDIPLLAERVAQATGWLTDAPGARGLPIGYFGASTGAAAALWAAASGCRVAAIVSRGGRPDLAAARLPQVAAPTLLIVGGDDVEVLQLNRAAQARLTCTCRLMVIPGATHLFEEPGALEIVADEAIGWFQRWFPDTR